MASIFDSTIKTKEEIGVDQWDIVAIDGDLLVYRAAFAAQKQTYFLWNAENELYGEYDSKKAVDNQLKEMSDFFDIDVSEWKITNELIVNEEQSALDALDTILKGIKKECPSNKYSIYLTGKGNYREAISVTNVYKGNRDKVEKPVHYQAVKDYIIQAHGAITKHGIEADDMMGRAMVHGVKTGKKTLAVNSDKDVRGAHGYMYDYFGDKWFDIPELEADRFFFWQCLVGDKSVDNIEGLKGVSLEFCEKYGLRKTGLIGKVAAEKLLKDCQTKEEMFAIVKEAYISYHGDKWEDMLNEQGKLLWIQREKDKVFDTSWFTE